MNVTQGDRAGEDVMCVRWMNKSAVEHRGRNKQMIRKTLTLSTEQLSLNKKNIRNVKHNGVFTHISVIQIFRLRLGPDVRQIPSDPRGMVRPNLPQSMWPRLESRGKGEMCVYVCMCFELQAAKCECLCLMRLHLKTACTVFVLVTKRPPSGGKCITWNISRR